MATLDEELRMDAEEDAREADFILSQLPSDLKERFTKEEILRLMDLIVEYYYESGVLDLDDDEIEIDLEQVADAICKKAKKEELGDYQADEVFFVVQADLDYQEQTL
jgi:hypothetical protein